MSVTLSDIATLAGVSPATASRAINGRPGVSEEKREAVLAAARELGMDPSRGMIREARVIVVVTPVLTDPVIAHFVDELGGQLARRGCLMLVCSDSGVLLPSVHLVDGAVVLDARYAESPVVTFLESQGVPMVHLNGRPDDEDGLCVGTDVRAAMAMVLRHLMDLGHRRIGLLMGPRNRYGAQDRLDAARESLGERGVEYDDELTVWTGLDVESGRLGARLLLERGATAVVCAGDELAMGAVRAARNLGMTVPDDVSVVGFGDSPMMATSVPSLTTVRQPVRRIVRFTLDALAAMLDNPEAAMGHRMLTFEPELVARESTGPCPTAARHA